MSGSYEVARIEAVITANNAKFDSSLRKSEQNAKGFERSVKTSFGKADAASANLGRGVARVEGSIQKIGSTAGRVGRSIATAFAVGGAVGIAAMGANIIRTSTNFDAAMSKVRAATGATQKEFDVLRRTAIDLGGSTIFSATEVADSMVALGKAGFKTRQQLDALPGVLDAAAASGEEMATVATVVVDTLGGFGLAAGNASHLADVLAHVANATTDDIGGLGEALKYVSPVAKDAGLSLDETAASLQILAAGGIKGSMAGTSLRGVLMSMQAPNIRVTKAMKELGLSFRDSSGNMLPMVENIDRLKVKLGTLSKSKADQFLARMFGRENITAAKLLLDTGGKGFQKITREAKAANGEAKKFAATMTDNLAGDVEQLKGALESAAIVLGDEFRPEFRQAVKELQNWVSSDDFLNTAHDVVGGVSAIGNAFVQAGQFAYDHRAAIAGLVGAYAGAKTAMVGFAAASAISNMAGSISAFVSLAGSVRSATDAVTLLKVATMGSPLGLITGAASLAGAALGIFALKSRSAGDASKYAKEQLDAYKGSLDGITNSVLDERQAHIASVQATAAASAARMRYSDAVSKFGANSRQARIAQKALTDAELQADAASVRHIQSKRKASSETAKLRRETQQAAAQYRNAKKSIQDYESQLRQYAKQGGSGGGANATTRDLKQGLEESKREADAAKSKLEALANKLPEIERAFGKGSDEVREFKAMLRTIQKNVDVNVRVNTFGVNTALSQLQNLNSTKRNSGFASGGKVRGNGSSTSDSIPALLSNGEFVIKASSVDKYGEDFLNAVNTQRFAKGGKVGKKKSRSKMFEDTQTRYDWLSQKVSSRSTSSDLVLARAEATKTKADDIGAYRGIIRSSNKNRRELESFLRRNRRRMSGSTREQVLQAIASEIRNVTSARDSIAGIRADQREQTKPTQTGTNTSNENQQAQIAQLQARLAASQESSRLNASAVMAFRGSGDIGFGGAANAYRAASGGAPTIIIQSLTGYDPRIEKAVTKVTNNGNATGGNRDRMYTGKRTTAI